MAIKVSEWVFENVSTAFVSIRVGEQVRGLAPKSVRPVTAFFRKATGGPDIDAARASESVKGLIDQGALKLYERESTPKVANVGRVWNETDPEEVRVQKVLDHRRSVKAGIKPPAPAPAPAPEAAEAANGVKRRAKE